MTQQEGLSGIPYAVVKRLPVYHRYLTLLKAREVERVSSRELADKIGINASQLRQDLNLFGSFGQQGYGYRVSELLDAIEKILGLDKHYKMVIVGAGNIGSAIACYPNFRRRGFEVTAIFDKDPELVGTPVGGVKVQEVAGLAAYLRSNAIDIGVIATPADAAVEVARILVDGGVRGIWNFAPVRLNVPDHVSLEQIHLGESLYSLVFKINQNQKERNYTRVIPGG